MGATIRYGKSNVSFYRTYARPLRSITPIAESHFSGRENILFAADVDVEVFGDNFMPAYTEGDNSNVVATDTMKNFVLQQALAYDGATLEGFLARLGQQFLQTYGQMQSLRLTCRELPFEAAPVPHSDGAAFGPSSVLFGRSHNDYATASLAMERAGEDTQVTEHQCGRRGLQLIKLTGSSFAGFARDGYTTLPERIDRPLFIYLDIFWRYGDLAHLLDPEQGQYVAAEQVRDCAQTIFDRYISKSIQNLVHEIGTTLLERFPQLAEVSFEAQNRLWDTAHVSEADPTVKVYCDPRPPYGQIGLTLRREA